MITQICLNTLGTCYARYENIMQNHYYGTMPELGSRFSNRHTLITNSLDSQEVHEAEGFLTRGKLANTTHLSTP